MCVSRTLLGMLTCSRLPSCLWQVMLNILRLGSCAWMRGYTISDVIHCIHHKLQVAFCFFPLLVLFSVFPFARATVFGSLCVCLCLPAPDRVRRHCFPCVFVGSVSPRCCVPLHVAPLRWPSRNRNAHFEYIFVVMIVLTCPNSWRDALSAWIPRDSCFRLSCESECRAVLCCAGA